MARVGRTLVTRRPVLTIALLTLSYVGIAQVLWHDQSLSLYGGLILPILLAKFILSMRAPHEFPEAEPPRVGVIITVYNEDAEYVRRCLDSVRAQTLTPTRIVLVDDASSDPGAREVARKDPDVTLLVHPVNLGKREAMATGFRELEGQVDVYACIDSDAELERGALAAGVRPFADPTIMASTGIVVPSNFARNVLTRIIDVRYVNAFLVERGAYSALRSVLCVCGVLAFYRADMIHRHLEPFLTQEFLGARAVVGDDRHLTNRALTEGGVVLVPEAVAHTAVPENLSHYVRQQSRWGRSFFRESLWSLRHHSPRRPAFWLTALELAQWVLFTSLLAYVLLVHPLLVGGLPILAYLAFVALTAVARSVRYFDLHREGQSGLSRAYTFALTPLFGLMNLLIMVPLRLFSLLTLRRSAWGTRAQVELVAEAAPALEPAPAAGESERVELPVVRAA